MQVRDLIKFLNLSSIPFKEVDYGRFRFYVHNICTREYCTSHQIDKVRAIVLVNMFA